MTRRAWLIIVLLGVAAAAYGTRATWMPQGASANRMASNQPPGQSPGAPAGRQGQGRPVPVVVAKAERREVPVRIDALGTVTPIASVAIKSRLETMIVGVHFQDGQPVKQGDLLFTLDSRSIEAQIRQAEGALARSRAQVEGSERDVRRFTELVGKNATPVTNLDNAKTQNAVYLAQVKSDEALLEHLKVQLSYCTIRAPISGRIGAATVRVGNFVRPSDVNPLGLINQLSPVYVTFAVPQRTLPDVRQAMNAPGAKVDAYPPGEREPVVGKVAMIENAVDAGTGMVTVRAVMENSDEVLWPGALVSTQLTVRMQEGVTIPSAAVQTGQSGTHVFVIKDGKAEVRQVVVDRTFEMNSVISKGIDGGDLVVTDGHLLLTNGARVAVRDAPNAGS